MDITWLVGVALIAAAAWAPERDQRDRTLGTGALLAIPVAFASSSVVLLMVASLSRTFQNAAVTWLAGATVLLALARTALTFREVRHLSEARLQARTDELTGLPNRRDFLERLSSLTERTRSWLVDSGTRQAERRSRANLVDDARSVSNQALPESGDVALDLIH